jgi:hypothetical protein
LTDSGPSQPPLSPLYPAASWWLKLGRARHHLAELGHAVEQYEALREQDVRPDYDDHSGRWVYTGHVAGIPSNDWPLILGDALVNARAALDHIALALNEPSARSRHIYFPILDEDPWSPTAGSRARAMAARFNDHTKGMRPGAVEVIKSWQPFASEDPQSHVLVTLQNLNNADKHKALIATVNAIPRGRFQYNDDEGNEQDKTLRPVTEGAVLKDGTKLTALPYRTDMVFFASVWVAFGATAEHVFDRKTFDDMCSYIGALLALLDPFVFM